jgi:hypothetical protein
MKHDEQVYLQHILDAIAQYNGVGHVAAVNG